VVPHVPNKTTVKIIYSMGINKIGILICNIFIFKYISFQTNDVIFLLHEINDDWLYGQVGQKQGMFPTNYVKVVVPLNDSKSSTSQRSQQSPAQIVTALYPFSAETWDDLELQVSVTVYWNSVICGIVILS
jgi:hypothetical protein